MSPQTPRTTAAFLLAQHHFGGDLAKFLRRHRKDGLPYSRIARELWLATDGEVDVTAQTIWKWAQRLGIDKKGTAKKGAA